MELLNHDRRYADDPDCRQDRDPGGRGDTDGLAAAALMHKVAQGYPRIISALAAADGGGFLAVAIDLPGCMATGDTAEAAVAALQQAIGEWLDEARRLRWPVPPPGARLAHLATQHAAGVKAGRP